MTENYIVVILIACKNIVRAFWLKQLDCESAGGKSAPCLRSELHASQANKPPRKNIAHQFFHPVIEPQPLQHLVDMLYLHSSCVLSSVPSYQTYVASYSY